jgi:hypothetical protein
MVYFQTKIPILGKFLDGLAMETDGKFWPFGLFYGHFVYFMVVWYVWGSLGIFFPFWYVVQRKIWQHCRIPAWVQFENKCLHFSVFNYDKYDMAMLEHALIYDSG